MHIATELLVTSIKHKFCLLLLNLYISHQFTVNMISSHFIIKSIKHKSCNFFIPVWLQHPILWLPSSRHRCRPRLKSIRPSACRSPGPGSRTAPQWLLHVGWVHGLPLSDNKSISSTSHHPLGGSIILEIPGKKQAGFWRVATWFYHVAIKVF